jgi:hypothetical protein
VNSGALRADRAKVRHSSDSYFVRLDVDPPAGHAPVGSASGGHAPVGREGLGAPARKHHRRRRRPSGRAVFLLLLVGGLGTWVVWAQQRPGGVSGTVDSWIANVRGDVAKVSTDPDFAHAQRYYQAQYKATHVYPQLSESDLGAVGVGVGVNVEWCGTQAVVIQGAQGGDTVSRLLLAGKDLGVQPARYSCPTDLLNPAPWKAP